MNYWRLTLERNVALAPENGLHELTVPDLLNLCTKPGTHMVFMPALNPDLSEVRYSEDLRNDLMKNFHLPEFFFEHMGWDANGFFGNADVTYQPGLDGAYKGCATFSRFLSKHLQDGNASADKSDYVWHFMGFATLWLKHGDIGHENESTKRCHDASHSTSETHIMLCFDFEKEMIQNLTNTFHRSNMAESQNEPFFLLRVALGTVVKQFEADLDSFRVPVRSIEKGRIKFSKVDEVNQLVLRYAALHEQSRHVLHIAETLGAASNSLSTITQEHELWMRKLRPLSALPTDTNTARYLKLYSNIVSNLKLRANAFVDRMDNEIKCASNLLGVVNNNIQAQTLKVTQIEFRKLQLEIFQGLRERA